VPADGIRLPLFLEAETSERRRFVGSSSVKALSLTVRERTTIAAYEIRGAKKYLGEQNCSL
jgi:hypothetical protein